MKNVNFSLHYSRARRALSCNLACVALFSAALFGTARLSSQSPALHSSSAGTKKTADLPPLRAVAVFEWTGDDPAKPKKSRLVPISIYDGSSLQDAGLYLARPEPLAIASEVEYQLKQNGKTIGLFDVKNAAQEEGSWVGYGEWKPAPAPKQPAYAATAKLDEDDEDDDKPVLHRKHHDGDSSGNSGTASGAKPADDSDRPKLHKKDDSGSTTPDTSSGSGSSSGGSATSSTSSGKDSGSDSDADRPTLHRKADSSSDTGSTTASSGTSGSSTASTDTDRPVMKKPKAESPDEDTPHVSALPKISDPDRPRLIRGQDTSQNLKVLPSLLGLPPEMRQTVGVSDAKDRPDHPWSYTWANPDDEARMKSALEDQARTALGLNTPPQPKPAPARRAASARKPGQTAKTQPAPAAGPDQSPVPLEGEQFRTFELAYGSGATFVLSAHTANPDPKQQKFATLIAQPDLYGNIAVLLKSVTSGASLDETPRMILIDAVDALDDNRGELLFELRGATQRQFALYRVLRGSAQQIFTTNGGQFASDPGGIIPQ